MIGAPKYSFQVKLYSEEFNLVPFVHRTFPDEETIEKRFLRRAALLRRYEDLDPAIRASRISVYMS